MAQRAHARPPRRRARRRAAHQRPVDVPLDVVELLGVPFITREYELRYHESKNPIFAWLALAAVLRDPSEPTPPWLTAYLTRVSTQMGRMRDSIPRDLQSAVYRALEFVPRRRVNPFRRLERDSHDMFIAIDVFLKIRGPLKVGERVKLDNAYDDVAREHPARCLGDPRCPFISRSTVRRIWKRHEKQMLLPNFQNTDDI